MHDFDNIRGFGAFLKVGGGLAHDFENTGGFGAFYPKKRHVQNT